MMPLLGVLLLFALLAPNSESLGSDSGFLEADQAAYVSILQGTTNVQLTSAPDVDLFEGDVPSALVEDFNEDLSAEEDDDESGAKLEASLAEHHHVYIDGAQALERKSRSSGEVFSLSWARAPPIV